MKKVTIVLPDDKLALIEELVKAITDMEIVEVKDMGSTEEFQRKSPKERLDAYSGDTRSPIPVISVHSVGNLQYRRQS